MHIDQVGWSDQRHLAKVGAARVHRIERFEIRIRGISVTADDFRAQPEARRELRVIERVASIGRRRPSADVTTIEASELRHGFEVEIPSGPLAGPSRTE